MNFVKRIYRKVKAELMFDKAVRMADSAHEESGRRYYVILDTVGKLLVTDRKNFRELRRKHYIDSKADLSCAIRDAVYYTPDASGHCIEKRDMNARRLGFIMWYVRRK